MHPGGGDDYELLFTAPPQHRAAVAAAAAQSQTRCHAHWSGGSCTGLAAGGCTRHAGRNRLPRLTTLPDSQSTPWEPPKEGAPPAHLEQLLVKAPCPRPRRCTGAAQRLAKALRPQNHTRWPRARRWPATRRPTLPGDVVWWMCSVTLGELRAKLLHALGKHGLFGVAHAVVQLRPPGPGPGWPPAIPARPQTAWRQMPAGHPHLLGGHGPGGSRIARTAPSTHTCWPTATCCASRAV